MSKEWSEQYRQSSMKVYHWKTRNVNDNNFAFIVDCNPTAWYRPWTQFNIFCTLVGLKVLFGTSREKLSGVLRVNHWSLFVTVWKGKNSIPTWPSWRLSSRHSNNLEIITSRFLHFSWESSQSSWYEKVWILTYWQ